MREDGNQNAHRSGGLLLKPFSVSSFFCASPRARDAWRCVGSVLLSGRPGSARDLKGLVGILRGPWSAVGRDGERVPPSGYCLPPPVIQDEGPVTGGGEGHPADLLADDWRDALHRDELGPQTSRGHNTLPPKKKKTKQKNERLGRRWPLSLWQCSAVSSELISSSVTRCRPASDGDLRKDTCTCRPVSVGGDLRNDTCMHPSVDLMRTNRLPSHQRPLTTIAPSPVRMPLPCIAAGAVGPLPSPRRPAGALGCSGRVAHRAVPPGGSPGAPLSCPARLPRVPAVQSPAPASRHGIDDDTVSQVCASEQCQVAAVSRPIWQAGRRIE